jgi:hypothetical protein
LVPPRSGLKKLTEFYAPYVRQGNPIIFMDERSAELTKYAANAFLAVKDFLYERSCTDCANALVPMWTWFAKALVPMTHWPAIPVSGYRLWRLLLP